MSGTGTRTARFGARSRLYGHGDKVEGVWGAPARRCTSSCIRTTLARPSSVSVTSRTEGGLHTPAPVPAYWIVQPAAAVALYPSPIGPGQSGVGEVRAPEVRH